MEQEMSSKASTIRAKYTQYDDVLHQLLEHQTKLIDTRKHAYRTLQGAARRDHVAAIDGKLETLKLDIAHVQTELAH